MVARHSMVSTRPETMGPTKRRSLKISVTRYTPETTRAPVLQNSYMLAHGTRSAAIPRETTAKAWSTNAMTMRATATRAAGRRVLCW